MTPDDLAVVDRSWAELRTHGPMLIARLTAALSAVEEPESAVPRAQRLVESTGELVSLLASPSQLAACARAIAATWGPGVPIPTFRIDGRAWMRAAGEVSPSWTAVDEVAWRRAWLLLSDVLAEDSLAPFGGPAEGVAPLELPYVAAAPEPT